MSSMSREEAIKVLQQDYKAVGNSMPKVARAYDVAISDMKIAVELATEVKKLSDQYYALKTWDCQLKDDINLLKKNIIEFKASVKYYQKYVHDNVADADSHDFIFERVCEDIDKYLGK